MMAIGNALRGLLGAALLISLPTACAPVESGSAPPVSPGPSAGIEVSADAPAPGPDEDAPGVELVDAAEALIGHVEVAADGVGGDAARKAA